MHIQNSLRIKKGYRHNSKLTLEIMSNFHLYDEIGIEKDDKHFSLDSHYDQSY